MFDGPVQRTFPDLDLDTFWDDSEYALGAYVDAPTSAALIASVEAELGYRLPASYVTLMRSHNGGIPNNTCCPVPSRTTWAEDHVAVLRFTGQGLIWVYCDAFGRSFCRAVSGYLVVCDTAMVAG
jgi:hypothetical protein